MKLTFLGTSGGEGYPGLWCQCEYCSYARIHGGKNYRENSSAVLDGDVLLDLNMTTFSQAHRLGMDISQARTLLVTHPHEDHFVAQHINWARLPAAHPYAPGEDCSRREPAPCCSDLSPLRVMGTRHVLEAVSQGQASDSLQGRADLDWRSEKIAVDFTLARPGVTVELGEDLRVTPLRSIHGPAEDYTVNYILQRGGKTLLYALDTGGYDDAMWEVLRGFRYDAVVLEGTAGLSLAPNPQHMNVEKLRRFFAALEEEALLTGKGQRILSHMAPHWTPPHDIFAPMMEREGITVAYDGLTVEI